MTKPQAIPRTANIPPLVKAVRLRTRLELSATKLDALADILCAVGLQLVAGELKQEAAVMRRAARDNES
jgi:hypothetical protein